MGWEGYIGFRFKQVWRCSPGAVVGERLPFYFLKARYYKSDDYVQIFSQRHATAIMRAENLHRILPSLQKKYASCVSPINVKIEICQIFINQCYFAITLHEGKQIRHLFYQSWLP